VGTRVDATGIVSIKLTVKVHFMLIYILNFLIFQFAIGTLMDDYLGNGMFNHHFYNAFKCIATFIHL